MNSIILYSLTYKKDKFERNKTKPELNIEQMPQFKCFLCHKRQYDHRNVKSHWKGKK